LGVFVKDKSIAAHANDARFMAQLENTKAVGNLSPTNYDAIYLTGGHGTMYDFVNVPTLSGLIAQFYEAKKIVSAVCHGVCGLLDVQLKDNSFLVSQKQITGYSWAEEIIARRSSVVPFNIEEKLRAKGAHYKKALLPLVSFVQSDGLLLTGQNPFSTKALAELVVQKLAAF
jgi:putative intracellular protease/amidase